MTRLRCIGTLSAVLMLGWGAMASPAFGTNYFILSVSNGRVLEATSRGGVRLAPLTRARSQWWNTSLSALQDRSFHILSIPSRKVLQGTRARDHEARVFIGSTVGGFRFGQMWRAQSAGDGTFYLVSVDHRLFLTASNDGLESVYLGRRFGTEPRYKWRLTPVESRSGRSGRQPPPPHTVVHSVQVPNVLGLDVTQAWDRFERAGLRSQAHQPRSLVPGGTYRVTHQAPAAGTAVTPGTEVNFYLGLVRSGRTGNQPPPPHTVVRSS